MQWLVDVVEEAWIDDLLYDHFRAANTAIRYSYLVLPCLPVLIRLSSGQVSDIGQFISARTMFPIHMTLMQGPRGI